MTDQLQLEEVEEWLAEPDSSMGRALDYLTLAVREIKRLQRIEAMWEDCARHRKQAEGRAARYRAIVHGVRDLLIANDEAGYPP